MAVSAGARQAIGMAAGWLTLAASAAVAVIYFGDIREGTRRAVGLPEPAPRQTAARERRPEPARSAAQASSRGREVQIRAGAHGHYYASAEINGRPVDVLVDTGASLVAMSYEDARRAGLFVRDSDFTQRVSTANGTARVAPVMLDRVSIGDITVRNVPAAVSEPGALPATLLGMSFLGRLQHVGMRAGILVLQE